jgi:thioredoxin-like negative regulator of GroEL
MKTETVTTSAEFKKHVLESAVPVVVYFHAPW